MTPNDSHSPHRRRRHGFTLVELIVALVVGAIVMFGARLMLQGAADGADRISRVARRTDREANAEWLLRSTVAALDAGVTGAAQFAGDQRGTRFTSWCDSAGGWQERCEAAIGITGDSTVDAASDDGARALLLTLSGAEPVRVREGFHHGTLLYLVNASDGGRWLQRWDAGLATPLAIGVVMDADTLILKVGGGR